MPKAESNSIDIKKSENNNNNTDNNYDIKLKGLKLKLILKFHMGSIFCSALLKDGRFATGSSDASIIIFNNNTFKPDLIINEHCRAAKCLIQLKSGILASCFTDETIKLYNIKKKNIKLYKH